MTQMNDKALGGVHFMSRTCNKTHVHDSNKSYDKDTSAWAVSDTLSWDGFLMTLSVHYGRARRCRLSDLQIHVFVSLFNAGL